MLAVECKKSLLEAPCCLHCCHTAPDDANSNHNSAHPDARTQSCHDEIGWQVEYNVADVEQRQACGDLFRRQMELRSEVMLLLQVHSLCQADAGPDCRAQKVESPER